VEVLAPGLQEVRLNFGRARASGAAALDRQPAALGGGPTRRGASACSSRARAAMSWRVEGTGARDRGRRPQELALGLPDAGAGG